jgi:hypothetical protein
MDKSVADLNIAHFKRLIEAETNDDKRKLLMRLLAEEEIKLASSLKNRPQSGK